MPIHCNILRGASMFLLEVWHPDILDFISAKTDEDKLNMANISVGISNDFMNAVKSGEEWSLVFPDHTHPQYDEEWDGNLSRWRDKGYPVKEYGTIPAEELWHKIARYAHKSAEPGIVWLERYNNLSNTQNFEDIRGVNPCGEQGLGDYGVCNLGAINFVNILDVGNSINWDKLRFAVRQGVKFLDTVIDHNSFIVEQTKEKEKKIRRVGLGTMGLADLMLAMGLSYHSDDALELIDDIYSFIRNEAYQISAELAAERGPAPAYYEDNFLEMPFVKELPQSVRQTIRKNGIRNLNLLTQAPTGTTSILAGVSSGIEPVYALEYTRKDGTGENKVRHWLLDKVEDEGQFVTAKELDPLDHVKVQARVQEYIDSSISKTINAPKDHHIEEVRETLMRAYSKGCKGVTYYREGTREGVMEEDNSKECPECGSELQREEGCLKCYACGWGKCSSSNNDLAV